MRDIRGFKTLLKTKKCEWGHCANLSKLSGRGRPHSKTLPRDPCAGRLSEGFGVRSSSTAMARASTGS